MPDAAGSEPPSPDSTQSPAPTSFDPVLVSGELPTWAELAPRLQAIASDLQQLQQCYTEATAKREAIQQVESQLHDLEAQLESAQAAEPDLPDQPLPLTNELAAEVDRLQTQLDELDLALKIRVLGESTVAIEISELFWYAVRFMGLSVVVGWLLAMVAMRSPAPRSVEPLPPETVEPLN